MKIIILFIIQCLCLSQIGYCQEGESKSENIPKYPLKFASYYCQSDTSTPIMYIHYFYNEKKIVTKATSFSDSSNKHITEFNYNEKGLLLSIYNYQFLDNKKTNELKIIFTYNELSQLISEEYENAPNNPKQQNTYNKKGQLISRLISGSNWKEEVSFFYDDLGRLSEKEIGNSTFIKYEYSQSRLVKEKIKNRNGGIPKEIIYEYDDSGLLTSKKENGKVIEKNIYQKGRLIKKWTNYYGIDPCFVHPCCQQDLSKFEYY